jgi:hypothetical protein
VTGDASCLRDPQHHPVDVAAVDRRTRHQSRDQRPGDAFTAAGPQDPQDRDGEGHAGEEFLAAKGERARWRVVEEVHEGGAALLPEIEARLDELDDLIRQAPTREQRRELQEQQANLLDMRDEKRAETPVVTYRQENTDRTFPGTGPRRDRLGAAGRHGRRAGVGHRDAGRTRSPHARATAGRVGVRLEGPRAHGPLPTPDETWVAAG